MAIKISNLYFQYNGKEVLSDITLSIKEGEYLSIIGPNAAGKSTLLKCINRILTPDKGTIEIFGKSIDTYDQKELGKLIGYVPQSRDHVFPYTVHEFVMMGRFPYLDPFKKASREDEKVVDGALAIVGLTHCAHRNVGFLSGGERQKVYLAGALAQQPKILLLDEPSTHLDPRHQIEIQKTISKICRDLNLTAVHVTHDLNHIFSFSQEIAAVKDGRLILKGRPEDVLTTDNLKNIFETVFLHINHPVTNDTIIIPGE